MHAFRKATALGSRTAWLRLLVNTVELVMVLPHVYPVGIYVRYWLFARKLH